MQNLTETRRKRFVFLNYVYTKSEGDEDSYAKLSDLADDLQMGLDEAIRVAQYLAGENLIKVGRRISGGGDSRVSITHWGVVQVEAAVSEPEKSTKYFPPVVNIISVGQMYGSQIQQSTQGSTQTGRFDPASLQGMIDAIGQAKNELSRVSLSADDRAEADAEIQTLEAQIKSPHLKPAIIKEAWAAILRIAESSAVPILIELAKRQLLPPGA